MENKQLPISVFIILLLSSVFAGHRSFRHAERLIADDLSRALAITVLQQQSDLITHDTIQACKQLQQSSDKPIFMAIADERFRKNIQNDALRTKAYISFGLFNSNSTHSSIVDDAICGDTLFLKDQSLDETLTLRGYARPNLATVFSLSDQRTSVSLALGAFLWAIFSMCYFRRQKEQLNDLVAVEQKSLGGMTYCEEQDVFYDEKRNPIHFTPMQQQLIRLFWDAPSHSLSKEAICASLWPKKEDANDTLYTLIRRIKPIIEHQTNLQITSDRGKGYLLEKR